VPTLYPFFKTEKKLASSKFNAFFKWKNLRLRVHIGMCTSCIQDWTESFRTINLGMNYSPSELGMVICHITTVASAIVTLTDSDGNSIYLRKCLPQHNRSIQAYQC